MGEVLFECSERILTLLVPDEGCTLFCDVIEWCRDVRKVVYIASIVGCEAQELASLGNICWDWPFLHNLYFLGVRCHP